MDNFLVQLSVTLLSLAIAGAVQPPQIAAGILLLLPKDGVANGLAFSDAMVAWRLAQGLLLWLVVSENGQARYD